MQYNTQVSEELLNRVVNAILNIRNSIGHKAYLIDKDISKFKDLVEDEDMFHIFNDMVDLWIPCKSHVYRFLKSKFFMILLNNIADSSNFGYSECLSTASKILKVVDGRSRYTVGEANISYGRWGTQREL